MKNKDFATFILTHGRPDSVFTYKTLKDGGYTGEIYIIVDNEDSTLNQYQKKFGDKVIVFDKKAISETFDEADNFDDRRSIVYARNACFQIAKDLGVKYFMQLDDDYDQFRYQYDNNLNFKHSIIKNLDGVFKCLLDFYKKIPAKAVAMAQGGDFIGGGGNPVATSLLRRRKCMNSFICSTDREFKFLGRINEDVNAYTKQASIGYLFLSVPFVSLNQKQTQSNSGGMTDIYVDNGTFVKSFYTVLFQPSSVKIFLMGTSHKRLHHRVSWVNTVPMIIKEKHKL